MAAAFVALGANLGDRAAQLSAALDSLRATPGINVRACSTFHETAPVGGPPGQPHYLNAAAELETSLDPATLLQQLLKIEQEFGRVRTVRDAPRSLDLDLLLYDDLIRTESDPILPHPRMHRRPFVLSPLAEIAPNARHPVLGRTIAELANRLARPGETSLGGMRALVTGSTSGIGREIANQLAVKGADVIVHGYRNEQSAADIATKLSKNGVLAHHLMADLRHSNAVDVLAAQAWNHWAGLDICICNAGADTLTGEAAQWPFEQKLDALWQVDIRSTIQLARSIGKRMKEAGSGTILTMGWDQADTGMEGDSGELFAAVKGAVMAFSRSLAKSLAPEVRVNVLAPGWIKTGWGTSASSVWQERVMKETPLKRWGTPNDVAATAAWLASPAATFVSGQIIRVNGGAI